MFHEDRQSAHLGLRRDRSEAIRLGFLRWQCRVRQMIMRSDAGRPGPGIMPAVTLSGSTEAAGRIITVMTRKPAFDLTPELRHIARRTQDPAMRRDAALQFLAASYYQQPNEFSDTLTATFPPLSALASAMVKAKEVQLEFDCFSQKFSISARVELLAPSDPCWQATWWHNFLFNPNLPANVLILAFVPDWDRSTADPEPSTAFSPDRN